jgi:hypothetical protein
MIKEGKKEWKRIIVIIIPFFFTTGLFYTPFE